MRSSACSGTRSGAQQVENAQHAPGARRKRGGPEPPAWKRPAAAPPARPATGQLLTPGLAKRLPPGGPARVAAADLPPRGAASVWLPLYDDAGRRLGEGEVLLDLNYKPFVDDDQDSGYREAEAFARQMQLQTEEITDIRSAAAASSRAAVAASAAISAIAMTKAAAARAAARAAQAAKDAGVAALSTAKDAGAAALSTVTLQQQQQQQQQQDEEGGGGGGGPAAGTGVPGSSNGNGAASGAAPPPPRPATPPGVPQLPADTAAARIAAAALAEVEELRAADESLRTLSSDEEEAESQRRWKAEVAAQQIRERVAANEIPHHAT
ncbi:hypothetical protein MNEG_15502 [Monoraphidium neglectum]|uniref:Uncharacterized protein n=1 Tax=Monoraphidium neglectum TaxID=145388 RepID=A0A0D2LRA6_9CHLO|nr:hypothetical protein MNEG_15502 [Monoraphidium neglectum]KIY92461.1 hypothetical protein MNEG_15502 [Monoraphidium neglectum]|eukprot:XP_013891481.1 hypothetical protein MNEG_15502 [Monoraphidium neglectum]